MTWTKMLVLAFVMVACTERVVEAITGRDHCKRGHEFTDANTLIHHGRRECRACVVLRRRQVQRHG